MPSLHLHCLRGARGDRALGGQLFNKQRCCPRNCKAGPLPWGAIAHLEVTVTTRKVLDAFPMQWCDRFAKSQSVSKTGFCGLGDLGENDSPPIGEVFALICSLSSFKKSFLDWGQSSAAELSPLIPKTLVWSSALQRANFPESLFVPGPGLSSDRMVAVLESCRGCVTGHSLPD